jgi:chemotaxis family two-component system response regulator Rcp1
MTVGPIHILLVEDNPGDVRLLREAVAEVPVHATVSVVGDGVEALAFLRREGWDAAMPRPTLILLDLNLPRLGGREVLAAIKGDPALRRIPVVVLSTSDAPADIAAAYGLHANAYVTKPLDLERFFAAVRALDAFWFGVAHLPPL